MKYTLLFLALALSACTTTVQTVTAPDGTITTTKTTTTDPAAIAAASQVAHDYRPTPKGLVADEK